jgi:hypothetical protein
MTNTSRATYCVISTFLPRSVFFSKYFLCERKQTQSNWVLYNLVCLTQDHIGKFISWHFLINFERMVIQDSNVLNQHHWEMFPYHHNCNVKFLFTSGFQLTRTNAELKSPASLLQSEQYCQIPQNCVIGPGVGMDTSLVLCSGALITSLPGILKNATAMFLTRQAAQYHGVWNSHKTNLGGQGSTPTSTAV